MAKKKRTKKRSVRHVKRAPSPPPPTFSLEELQRRLAAALAADPGLRYAIGGATAMAVHGYQRATADVDVFVLAADLNRLMAGLRRFGLETFIVLEPSHYVAKLPGDPDHDRRIDVLVPFSEPELSAIEFSDLRTMTPGGVAWRFFPAGLLAMAKFVASEYDPRHALDLMAMYRRGIFDARQLRVTVGYLDEDDLPRFDALIASFTPRAADPRRRGPKGGGRRLPPPGERGAPPGV